MSKNYFYDWLFFSIRIESVQLVLGKVYFIQFDTYFSKGVGTPQSPCDVGGMPKNQYGPTYGFSDGKNGFLPDLPIGSKKANRPCPIINGPVWGVGTGSGKYAPMPTPKVGSELLMSGPVFPIPDHYSKYTTQNFGCSGSGLKVERPKELCGPGNRDIGDR